ncbi:MAG: hypothetical protein KDJ34_16650 [Candidatus Competibacteraceae bacterium]|nr:hypothetical protein [Candidatus Competibacteraceae bacterium]
MNSALDYVISQLLRLSDFSAEQRLADIQARNIAQDFPLIGHLSERFDAELAPCRAAGALPSHPLLDPTLTKALQFLTPFNFQNLHNLDVHKVQIIPFPLPIMRGLIFRSPPKVVIVIDEYELLIAEALAHHIVKTIEPHHVALSRREYGITSPRFPDNAFDVGNAFHRLLCGFDTPEGDIETILQDAYLVPACEIINVHDSFRARHCHGEAVRREDHTYSTIRSWIEPTHSGLNFREKFLFANSYTFRLVAHEVGHIFVDQPESERDSYFKRMSLDGISAFADISYKELDADALLAWEAARTGLGGNAIDSVYPALGYGWSSGIDYLLADFDTCRRLGREKSEFEEWLCIAMHWKDFPSSPFKVDDIHPTESERLGASMLVPLCYPHKSMTLLNEAVTCLGVLGNYIIHVGEHFYKHHKDGGACLTQFCEVCTGGKQPRPIPNNTMRRIEAFHRLSAQDQAALRERFEQTDIAESLRNTFLQLADDAGALDRYQ